MSSPKVLLVIRHRRRRLRAGRVLFRAGYDVTAAGLLLEAIEAARQHPFAVAIVDEDAASGMDFAEIARLMRAQPGLAEAPLLCLTEHAATADIPEGFKAGVDAYLLKGYSDQELLHAAENLAAGLPLPERPVHPVYRL